MKGFRAGVLGHRDIRGGNEVGHWCHRGSRARFNIRLNSQCAFLAQPILQFRTFRTAPFIRKLTTQTRRKNCVLPHWTKTQRLAFFSAQDAKKPTALKRRRKYAQADHYPRDNSDTPGGSIVAVGKAEAATISHVGSLPPLTKSYTPIDKGYLLAITAMVTTDATLIMVMATVGVTRITSQRRNRH